MHVHCCHKLDKKFQPYKLITSRDTGKYSEDLGEISEVQR